jgi:deoxyribose-phosphate aldolase
MIKCNADFVKTSTGFGLAGATGKDIRLLKDLARGRIRIKASGGIKTLTETLAMIDAGVERVGTSSGIRILNDFGTEKE